ncbi:hypothetical protein SDC9_130297 [bioreactor metagenome]|uniref:Uncharacterized protein n=1 Tax=bioreactor metagenome TaxID=1076179 RepID=A0A645D1T6_9ZZZZ
MQDQLAASSDDLGKKIADRDNQNEWQDCVVPRRDEWEFAIEFWH